MNVETLLDKFDDLAETPDGVRSLREMVLRVAFRGGLSGQLVLGDGLPEGWESRTIDSMSSSITPGFACSRSNQTENGHVHLRTHNISTLGKLNLDLLVRIDPRMIDPQKAAIRTGDILFNNTNSQALVGKTSLVEYDREYAFSNHITRIRLKNDVLPGFVAFYLTMLRNTGHFARICTRWINQAAVNTEALKRQTVPVPPLADQQRIVAKVDELMVLCDRLEMLQQERESRHAELANASTSRFASAPTPTNLPLLFHPSYTVAPSDLRKAILALAVQGRLVPQDAREGSAESLLASSRAKMVALMAAGRAKKERAATPVDESEAKIPLPANWVQCRLVDAGQFINGLAFKPSDWGPVGRPIIRIQNLSGRNPDYNRTRGTYDSSILVKDGDILVSWSATLDAYVWRGEEGVLNQHIFRVIPSPAIDKQFLYWLLKWVIRQLAESDHAHGLVMTHINRGPFLAHPIPLPPIAEQRRIVVKLEQLMEIVDELEAKLIASHAVGSSLMSAVVAELAPAS